MRPRVGKLSKRKPLAAQEAPEKKRNCTITVAIWCKSGECGRSFSEGQAGADFCKGTGLPKEHFLRFQKARLGMAWQGRMPGQTPGNSGI